MFNSWVLSHRTQEATLKCASWLSISLPRSLISCQLGRVLTRSLGVGVGGTGDEAHLSSFQDGGRVKKSINILKVKSKCFNGNQTTELLKYSGRSFYTDISASALPTPWARWSLVPGCLMHSMTHICILRLYPLMPTQLWHAKLSLHIATSPLGGKTASGWDLFLYINGPWLPLLLCTAFMLKAAEQSNRKKWEP